MNNLINSRACPTSSGWQLALPMAKVMIRVVVKLVWCALGALSLNFGTVRTFTMHQNCSIILLYIDSQVVMTVVSDASSLWFESYEVCQSVFFSVCSKPAIV